MTFSLVKGFDGLIAWDRGLIYIIKEVLETLVLGQRIASKP